MAAVHRAHRVRAGDLWVVAGPLTEEGSGTRGERLEGMSEQMLVLVLVGLAVLLSAAAIVTFVMQDQT